MRLLPDESARLRADSCVSADDPDGSQLCSLAPHTSMLRKDASSELSREPTQFEPLLWCFKNQVPGTLITSFGHYPLFEEKDVVPEHRKLVLERRTSVGNNEQHCPSS